MNEKPRRSKGTNCPLYKKDVSTVCHKCEFYTHVRGKNPQSEETVDRYACAIAWLPTLMIENSQMQRQTGAAVESFRNEVVDAANRSMAARALTYRG
jgi:hypothetical protein